MQQSTARPFVSLGYLAAGAVAAALLALSGPAWVSCERAGADRIAASLRFVAPLHLAVLSLCALLVLLVCGLLVYSLATAGATGKDPGTSRARRLRNVREVLWAIVPVVIVVAASVPAMVAFRGLTQGVSPAQAGIDAGYVCRVGVPQ